MRHRWVEYLLSLAAVQYLLPSASGIATEGLPSNLNPSSPAYIYSSSPNDANVPAEPQVPPRLSIENKLIFGGSNAKKTLDSWDLEDYVLVATVEGSLYALDRYSGAQKWVLEGHGPAVRSKGTNYNGVNTTDHPDSTEKQPKWIVQPVEGGQLFLFDSDFGVLVKFLS